MNYLSKTKKLLIMTTVSAALLNGVSDVSFASTVDNKTINTNQQTKASKQAASLQQVMKLAKKGENKNDQAVLGIRLNTVKETLGKPVKEIEYKGAHLVTYKAGNYELTFEFLSVYNDRNDKNPKVISYNVNQTKASKQAASLQQVMKLAKKGENKNDQAVLGIRLNTVKETLGKPAKEIEYKGAHLVTYKAGNYELTFEFLSVYNDRNDKNPKVISYNVNQTKVSKQAASIQQVMKLAKKGENKNDQAVLGIRLNTVKETLGKPAKEIEYKGAHLVTYKAGNYELTFEFLSVYNDKNDKNPKVVSYNVY
ncbi:DUF4309 domain-containing protein [Viridibacillus sp. NPDC093762]|uniref:DUF4309 domain-containing protein n=1 Tax=Viridibacillus sp. NPDC093762 TaxID=3390720 RepID=UPI003D01C2A2